MASSLAAVFVGSDTLLLQCLDSWRERGNTVACVLTDTDKVRRYCAENGLRCLPVDQQTPTALANVAFDYLFAITWLRLLPPELLALPRQLAINFHDGPLPRYAGLNATCWSLLNGESEHAVSWHIIEAKADTGDILVQHAFPIAADDTAFTLNARCFAFGTQSFGELIEQLANGTTTGTAQDLTRRSYFGRHQRPHALAVIDFAQPVQAVSRLVRAFDHGGYQNPIAVAKVRAINGVFVPSGIEVVATGSATSAAAGTVVAASAEFVQIACADGDVKLLAPRCLRGLPLSNEMLRQYGVIVGDVLPVAEAATRDAWTDLGAVAAPGESAWVQALRTAVPLSVPDGQPHDGAAVAAEVAVDLQANDAQHAASLCAAFLLRSAGAVDGDQVSAGLGFADANLQQPIACATDLAVPCPPTAFVVADSTSVGDALASMRATMAATSARGPLLRELLLRRSDALSQAVTLDPPVRLTVGIEIEVAPSTLTFAVAADGSVCLRYDARTLPEAKAVAMAQRLAVFARAAAADPSTRLTQVPVLDEAELQRLLHTWNDTATDAIQEPCVHRQFQQQVQTCPDHRALICDGASVTYRELQIAVDRLAGWLRGRGVNTGDRVGICTGRGFGMVTAALAVMRCGAAYVPLDPSYPRDRLAFMAEDAELAALIVDHSSAGAAPAASCPRIDLDADRDAIAGAEMLLDDQINGDHLAYLIYTSGSTGRPKGVMVQHRNVANFFVGMDHVLGADRDDHKPGVWLAVTSLSFDISVLELLWTLCRGFTVVLHTGDDKPKQVEAPAASTRPVSFSMFYFASDEGEFAQDKYRLLIEGAKFADQNGFEAVWTPERHFHAFGGLYPNPAVVSAAVAAITKNVGIRAGSCVATLHHPIRIAEDWALVDNLSNGRVGIAFAAGWHGRDFVLKPENFADRKGAMMRTMAQVHALWRGEEVEFPGHDGKPQAIRTLPRPVQKKLPTWVTVAGNPETFRLAGESGSYVLTHLLGQSMQDLDGKLDVYHAAWRKAGHEGVGRVTLMLHTFVGDDESKVREIVRQPMKEYLRSSLDLVKQAAWSFPAFKNKVDKPGEMDELLNGGLTPADFEALLDFSFERYYQQSGLFGTPESCVAIVDRLRAIKIDEIACLVDFGVPTDLVMASLPHLQELKRRCDTATAAEVVMERSAPAAAKTIPQLITEHQVTHFQCTPSMAGMLLLDPDAPKAFGTLQQMLVGGEALPSATARQLQKVVPVLHDVYGPTETTVWSTTQVVGDDEPVPIGKPMRNQQVYVLDHYLQPVPTGGVGELWIGGDGVTAGYFRRPELTDDRFRADPFGRGGDGTKIYGTKIYGTKIYGTGDLVRWRDDGLLEYLGRKDLQVKIRGYRIELGEIEAAMSQHSGIREVVVVARSDGGDARLVAYYVARSEAPTADQLRDHLRHSLPEFMVPSHFVVMPDLPRTPNLKVDRKALPAPEAVASASRPVVVSAADETEDAILAIWKQSLGTDDVGVEDNFFDSGGHSILAVKVHREIAQRLGVDLQVTDLFRFTTVRALAKHLQTGKSQPTAAQQAMERAKNRRLGLTRRR
ncbi:MAG: natural product biosynthesis luciferase-like monooxygenase protein [Planctomycetota bacterium]|jgi:natural product biosynthesis luciferase-like monooxygenase protein